MHKVLIETSAYVDIQKAAKNHRKSWAQNTLRNLLAYRAIHPKLTITVLTAYEMLDGLYRRSNAEEAQNFLTQILPAYEVIYPSEAIIDNAAEINAALSKGQAIGTPDTLIAATAIIHELPLVNANTKHFTRVIAAGFPLMIENWREG